MKNKKSQIFSVGLVLITIVAITAALVMFFGVRNEIETSITVPSELLNDYHEKTKILFYSSESIGLASQTAFSSIVKKGVAGGDCKVVQLEYILWNDSCMPKIQEISEKFLSEFNNTFKTFIQDYSKEFNVEEISFEDGNLEIVLGEVILKSSNEEGYVSYNSSFSFKPVFSYELKDLVLEDFENIYSKTKECQDKDVEKVKNCLLNQFGRWDLDVKINENYLLFDFTTSQSFFDSESYSPVVLKFALSL